MFIDFVFLKEVDSWIGLHVKIRQENDDWVLFFIVRSTIRHLHQCSQVLLCQQDFAMIGKDFTHEKAIVSNHLNRLAIFLVFVESALDLFPEGSEIAI